MSRELTDSKRAEVHHSLSQFLVGRIRERERFLSWLADPKSTTTILSISGIGGIGKTTLMMDLADAGRQTSALTIWLDGRMCARMPSDLLSSIEKTLENEYGIFRHSSIPLLTHVTDEFSKRRTTLFIDNWENSAFIESWLLSSFFPRLAAMRVMLVFASRTGLPIQWRTHPFWRSRMETMNLDLFTHDEMREYLQPYKLAEATAEMIARKTNGHPLSVALVAEACQKHDGDLHNMTETIPSIVNTEMLKEVTTPLLHEALQVLSLLPLARHADLVKLMMNSFDVEQYRELCNLSFIRITAQGLSLHDVVTRLLRQDLRQREPSKFRHLCKDVFRLLADQFPNSDKLTQIRIAAHVLDLYLELTPIRHSYADFPSTPMAGRYQPFQMEDLPHLHRILADAMAQSTWQCEFILPGKHHELLDEIAVHCPEGIRVVRSETGVPLTMGAGVWLHEKTLFLLERYAPRCLDDALRDEISDLRTMPHELMNSICILLSAVDVEHPLYRPKELGVLSFQDWFTLLSVGARCIVASGDAQLNHLLLRFGYQEKMNLSAAVEADVITILELDFRNAKFSSWVKAMIQQLDNEESSVYSEKSPQAHFSSRLLVPRSGMKVYSEKTASMGTFIQNCDLEEMLKNLDDLAALEKTPFARLREISGLDLQRRIQSLLTTEEVAFPMTKLHQTILRESYAQREVAKSVLAVKFHMSRTTFYRHTRRAMNSLGQALTQAYLRLSQDDNSNMKPHAVRERTEQEEP
ncbi:MAG: NB-ARC domain-containing protein [Bacilli bacterium]